MNIVVFGAAGWVGRAVLENLRAHHHVRAVDHNETAWESLGDIDGDWQGDETVHCDIVDYAAVDGAMEGMDAVIHTTVLGGGSYGTDDEAPFLVNLKGLWNVLNAARQRGIGRVVHVGSCQVEHPHGVFFDAHVRRPDGSLYAVTKRLQEEMCRQFHDAFGLAVVVLRPCSIVAWGSARTACHWPAGGTRAGYAATTWPRPAVWRPRWRESSSRCCTPPVPGKPTPSATSPARAWC